METMKVRKTDDGKLVMTVPDVLEPIGYFDGSAATLADLAGKAGTKYKLLDFGDGVVGVSAEDGDRLIRDIRAYIDDHNAKWRAYREYVERTKREALEKRAVEAAEERKRIRQEQARYAAAWDEQRRREAEAEVEERNRRAAEAAGNPVSFDKFSKNWGSAA